MATLREHDNIVDVVDSTDRVVATLTVNPTPTALADNSGRFTTYTVAASDAPALFKATADYICDGVDDHVEIQAAIDAATPGGRVLLSPGNFLGGQVVVKDRVDAGGMGMHSTTYKLKNGANVDAWINFVSPDNVAANAEFIKIRDMRIDGNKANQSSGRGIYLNVAPSGSKATNDLDFDPHNLIENVLIQNTKGDGFASASRSETRLINVYCDSCDGNSFVPSYDMFMIGCTASNSGLRGFYITHSSVRMTNCKAFYSGQVTATLGYGFNIASTFGCIMAGCEAQDNKASGLLLDTSTGCNIQMICDSNSTRGVGSSPAIDIWDGGHHEIKAVCTERKADGTNSYQRRAIRIRTASTGSKIDIQHFAQGGATVDAAVDTIDANCVSNALRINGMGSVATPAFAASLTLDPYVATTFLVGALTNNITINAPSNAHPGCELVVKLVQDGTGSRTITWNAIFKNTPATSAGASTYTVGRFVYDGTNWIGG